MKIGYFLDTENPPQANLILEQMKFYSEWASSDFTFEEAFDRSIQRKLSEFELLGIGTVSRAFPIGREIRNLPAVLSGRLNRASFASIYGGRLIPIGTPIGLVGRIIHDQHSQSSGRRDAKPVSGQLVGPVLRPRQLKPSRPGSPGQTSKPFWSKGKPKCKKGFRYDFKRKLCVKIK